MMQVHPMPHRGFGHHLPHYHGFCRSCCHPMHLCCCGVRECRKIPKELLATPAREEKPTTEIKEVREKGETGAAEIHEGTLHLMSSLISEIPGRVVSGLVIAKQFTAVIGGGCCVHLSVEYFPTGGADSTNFTIKVVDSDGTLLAWGKQKVPPGYHIKEGIITTRPGAILAVAVKNAIVRVRWCEVIAC